MVTERPLWMRPVCSYAARSAGIECTMILHAVIGMDGKPVALHLPFGVNSPTQRANLPGPLFPSFRFPLSTPENLTPSVSIAACIRPEPREGSSYAPLEKRPLFP